MIFEITVKPNSKKGNLILVEGNQITAYLRARPVEGQANDALLKLLAKHFHVPKTQIIIKTGAKSRKKLIEIPKSVV